MRITRWSLTAAAVLACACGAASPDGPPRQTVQELMDTRIDPAADVLWDSVAFIASESGEEDRRPQTPAQWESVRQAARTLIQAAADLTIPGRRVAAVDKPPGPGELNVSDIQRRIDANPAAFAQRAQALGAAAQQALAAIDAKNAEALMDAGGLIDAACEACHVLYWYPQQVR
ncbi:MAG TPA: hypothetical protein VHY75_05715 [Steroidobacteraceae bacterium]|nr:hypothetical protein [Steroidobacteraceae bacterium]